PGSGRGGETPLTGMYHHGGGGGTGGPERSFAVHGSAADAMRWAKDQLRKEGVPEEHLDAAAAALVGNAIAESGLNPQAIHDKNPRTGTFGYGIYGASAVRKGPMFAWEKAHGFVMNSFEGQQRYMAHEAMTKYRASRDALMR